MAFFSNHPQILPIQAAPNTQCVQNRDAFCKSAQAKKHDAVIFSGYPENPEVEECLQKHRYNGFKTLSPTNGIVAPNATEKLEIHDGRALDAPLAKEIFDLGVLFLEASENDKAAFTLSNIRNGVLHIHFNPFMTFSFSGVGTLWKSERGNHRANSRSPTYIQPMLQHKSPEAETRLVCTFFPYVD